MALERFCEIILKMSTYVITSTQAAAFPFLRIPAPYLVLSQRSNVQVNISEDEKVLELHYDPKAVFKCIIFAQGQR